MTLKFAMQKVRHVPPRVVQRLRNHGVGNTLAWFRYQAAWRWRERQLGINTAEHAFGLDVFGTGGGQGYEPIDHRCCDTVLDYLNPDPRRDVFFDYGCGLGRALILAGMRPFRRVLGIEINEQLVELGRTQVESARSRGKLVCDVELIHADAATYELPHDVNRVFIHNAFVGDLLQTVLQQIRKSLVECPRDLVLVHVPLLKNGDGVENCPWFDRRCELPTAFWEHAKIVVYEARRDELQAASYAGADATPRTAR